MSATESVEAAKKRRRAALLEAARALMARGEELSVTAVAKKAGVSRATAYRYYPDPETLALDAMDRPGAPPPEPMDSQCPRERAHRVRREMLDRTREAEAQMRQYLARAMDSWVAQAGPCGQPPREVQRLRAFRAALAPMRTDLGEAGVERAALMLSVVSGVESWAALRDVCGLTDSATEALSSALTDAVLDAVSQRRA